MNFDKLTIKSQEAVAAAQELARRYSNPELYPEHLTQEFNKVDRKGRIYVDTGRNGYSATFAAAYTVRAKAGAPVSAPCSWDEIEKGKVAPDTFNLRNMPARIKKAGDVWADLLRRRRSLKKPVERLKRMADSTDQLGRYLRIGP